MIQTELFNEVSPLYKKDCFIIMERTKSTFNFPIHIHPEYELNFIEQAKGAQRIVGDSIEEIGSEELVLITNPKLEHAWVNHNCTSSSIHEITIQFHPDLFNETFLDKNQFKSIEALFNKAKKGVVFDSEAINKVKPLLKTITCETDSFYSVIKLLIILHELSTSKNTRELSSTLFCKKEENKSGDNVRMNKVIAYLNNNYHKQIRLQDVAELISMSESSFCRFIKQRTSKSFVDFLTDLRLGVASRLLIDSSNSIAEIGYSCGFNNLSNFNRIFKKKKNVPPTEFRENYRKKKVIV